MDPRVYVPTFLEHRYELAHPDLTPAARELLRDQISQDLSLIHI